MSRRGGRLDERAFEELSSSTVQPDDPEDGHGRAQHLEPSSAHSDHDHHSEEDSEHNTGDEQDSSQTADEWHDIDEDESEQGNTRHEPMARETPRPDSTWTFRSQRSTARNPKYDQKYLVPHRCS